MADGGRTAPGTLDRRNWVRDTREYPAEPCVTVDCDRPRVALGYCDLCAAVALTNRGVLRRRTRTLLTLLATDEDLTSPAAWTSWKATLANAVADVQDVLDSTGDLDSAYLTTQCPLCGGQPEQTTEILPEVPPERASPQPDAPVSDSGRCTGCGLELYEWERKRGTCAACHRHQAAA